MKRVDVARTLIVDEKNQKILMVKNVRDNNTFDFTLPGGAVEEGETLVQAAEREALEETGLIVEAGELAAIEEACFEKNGHHAIFFTFLARIVDGDITITRPEEILEVFWVDLVKADELLLYAFPYGISTLLKKIGAPYYNRGLVK